MHKPPKSSWGCSRHSGGTDVPTKSQISEYHSFSLQFHSDPRGYTPDLANDHYAWNVKSQPSCSSGGSLCVTFVLPELLPGIRSVSLKLELTLLLHFSSLSIYSSWEHSSNKSSSTKTQTVPRYTSKLWSMCTEHRCYKWGCCVGNDLFASIVPSPAMERIVMASAISRSGGCQPFSFIFLPRVRGSK